MKALLRLSGVLLALALLFLARGLSPGAGLADHTIATVGIDAVTTGNTLGSLATIDDCGSLAIGRTSTIDIYIGDDPRFQNDNSGVHELSTLGATMSYNPTLLRVTAIQAGGLFMSDPVFVASNALPDSDGAFDFIVIDLSAPFSSGTGVAARLTIEGVARGISPAGLGAGPNSITLFAGEPPLAFSPSPQSPQNAEIVVGGLGNCNDFDSDGWCDPGFGGTALNPCTLGLNDNCPLLANPTQTNSDAQLEIGYKAGDACDPDDDGDGYWDDYELFRGSNPLSLPSTPEVCDAFGVTARDNDKDGLIDEDAPDANNNNIQDCLDPAIDSDGDGQNNLLDSDDDNDGFRDDQEDVITTNSLLKCANSFFSNTFPPDQNYLLPSTGVDAQDLVALLPSLFTSLGMLNFDHRKNVRLDTVIDAQDLVAISTRLFIVC